VTKWLLIGGALIAAYLVLRPRGLSSPATVQPRPAGTGQQIGSIVDGVARLFQ
jgi:hypothetical protein